MSEPHQRAIWRRLRGTGLWPVPRFPISDAAGSQRLAGAGTAPLAAVFEQVSTVLAARLAAWPVRGAADLAPCARAVVARAETTLDPVARTLPSLRGTPTEACLPGTLAGVVDLRTHGAHHDGPPAERDDAGPLTLPARRLLLADLG